MEQESSNGIAFVAWWGAILATIIFVWDIYKWITSGAKIRFSVLPNIITSGYPSYDERQYHISVSVTNVGDRPTTITTLAIQQYTGLFKKVFDKPSVFEEIAHPNPIVPLPYVLKPGEIWQGLMIQDERMENLAKNGYLYCKIYHSQGKKGIRKRIIIK